MAVAPPLATAAENRTRRIGRLIRFITSAGHEPVVIVSLEDDESLRETAYLMRSPSNTRRLLDAMERMEAGRGEARDLVEIV